MLRLRWNFLAFVLISTVQCYDSNEKSAYKFHNPVTADLNSPWITGLNEKRYQFHIGQQSWLSARENCLAQNADLVTISNDEELNWILDHYKPQFAHVKERQIQIGLLIDHPEVKQTKEWRWVDQTPLNDEILKWTSGEPFDHAFGRERCAFLNVNARRLQDVDCDLHGSSDNLYRFICERSGEKHVQHEMLNNPLLKKLTDILDFFGVSSSATSALPADNSDYVDSVANDSAENATSAATTVSATTQNGEDESQNSTTDEISTTVNNKDNRLATIEETSEVSTTVEAIVTTDSKNPTTVLIDETLSTTSSPLESSPATSFSTSTIFESTTSETLISESASSEPTIPFTHEAAALLQIGKKLKTGRTKAYSGGKSVKSNSRNGQRLEEFAHDAEHGFNPRNHRLIDPEGVHGIPVPMISHDAANHDDSVVETASITKRADPLEKIADTLERSISESNNTQNATDDNEASLPSATEGKSSDGTKMTKRIHTLERIISAVQKMVEHPENIASDEDEDRDEEVNTFTLRNKVPARETIRKHWAASDRHVDESPISWIFGELMPTVTSRKGHHNSKHYDAAKSRRFKNDDVSHILNQVAHMYTNLFNDISSMGASGASGDAEAVLLNTSNVGQLKPSEKNENDRLGLKITVLDNGEDDLAFNIEGDFLEAQKESREHPNVNSGDFVIRASSDVIGSCGESDASPSTKIDKHSNVREFVQSLRKYLKSDENSELKKILEDKTYGNVTLLEKIEEAAKLTAGNNTFNKKQTSQSSKDDEDPENPVKSLIRLYEAKFQQEKKEKIDSEILEELKHLEAEDQEISKESNENGKEGTPAKVKWSSEDADESQEYSASNEAVEIDTTTTSDIINSLTVVTTNTTKTADETTIATLGDNKQSNETAALNPTDAIMEVMTHNPTQELIEAILDVQDRFRALIPSSNSLNNNASTREGDDSFPMPPPTMGLSFIDKAEENKQIKAKTTKSDQQFDAKESQKIKQLKTVPSLKDKADSILLDKTIKSTVNNFVAV